MNHKTIPNEVLGEIFLILCENPIALHVLENREHFDKFPWATGQVCKRWREVFISHARLWTSLSLVYTYVDGGLVHPNLDNSDEFVEMDRRTTLYLERSKQSPLTISVSIRSGSALNRVTHFPRSTWKQLLSCSDRWKEARLGIWHVPDMLDDLSECRHKTSSLESLVLVILGPLQRSEAQDSLAFETSPRLTKLRLIHFGVRAIRWVFPWSQLTKLDTGVFHSNPDTQIATLSQLHNLEELHFVHDSAEFSPATHVRFPSLRILKVSSNMQYPYIFKWCETPSLEHLWLECSIILHDYSTDDWNATISSFIQRSSCLILRLTLHSCHYELGRLLMKVVGPSIKQLSIHDPRGNALPLIQHIADSEDGICLPHLQEFHVMCCSGRANDEFMGAISRVLVVRGEGSMAVPLERVILDLKWGEDSDCQCDGRRCCTVTDESIAREHNEILRIIRNWPSVTDISLGRTRSLICSITLHLAA